MTPKEAAFRLHEWYQAFQNFGKGNERTVHEFLEAADLIESLAAELEDMTARYKIADDCAKKKGEMNEKLYAELTALKAERDAAVADLKYVAVCETCKEFHRSALTEPCLHCTKYGLLDSENKYEWRGVQKEDGNAQ